MNYNQIQALLEKLPDQQIMMYAQGGNPQVPQVLAQMEAMRRENLRKSETMQSPGIAGMAKGGIVRKFAEGGPVKSYRNAQERRDALLESAKRKRGAQMKENEVAFKERAGQVFDDVTDMAKAGIGFLIPDVVERNFARQQAMRDPQAAAEAQRTKAYEDLMMQAEQMPAPAQQGIAPLATPNAADARADAVLAQGPTAFQTNPKNVPPGIKPPPTEAPGIGGLAPMAGNRVPAAPAQPQPTAANPQAADVLTKMEQAKDAQLNKFAEIFAQMDQTRKASQGPAPDADLDRKRAFYRALSKFGAALATTGIWAQAGDVGLDTFRSELDKSEAKQKEFRKEALQIGLAGLEDKLKMLGYEDAKIKEMRDEAQRVIENDLKTRQVATQEQQVKQQGEYQRASIGVARENAKNRFGGGSQAITYKDALKEAGDAFKENPRLAKRYTVEEYATMLYNSDPTRSGILSAGGDNMGAGSMDGWGMPTVK